MQEFISGIQQIGIGVKDAGVALRRYADLFGMNALVFNDISDAHLMARYTGGNVYRRQALLSLNMQGGGGFEIWQFTDRKPSETESKTIYGDLGINAAKLKCGNIGKAHDYFTRIEEITTTSILTDGKGHEHFWLKDDQQNLFNIVTAQHWFQQKKSKPVGGVAGAVIGVSNMERSIAFYGWLLNTDIVYDTIVTERLFDGEEQRYRKVLLNKHCCGKGAFGKLLGPVEIELVQCLDRAPVRIYENRYWGDCGFIHLCFDVFDMSGLKKYAGQKGYNFTVDSIDSFGMQHASGRFCYVEDPDGTLIELVETHKVPVLKKMGLYINLKRRNLEKPLPDWIIKLLALNRVK
jgi:catechol 2,3-dioxygenase-like lactoylglutathione lyase family enzyme